MAFLDSEQPLVYKEKLDSNTYLHEKSQDDLRGGLEPFMNPSCQIDKNVKRFPGDLLVTSIVRCSRCTSYIAVVCSVSKCIYSTEVLITNPIYPSSWYIKI